MSVLVITEDFGCIINSNELVTNNAYGLKLIDYSITNEVIIPTIEDRIAQQVILLRTQILVPIFKDVCYSYCPNNGAHQAIG